MCSCKDCNPPWPQDRPWVFYGDRGCSDCLQAGGACGPGHSSRPVEPAKKVKKKNV